MPRLNIAIVGAGMIGAVHRRAAMLAGAEVRGVCASTPERSREVADRWNVSRAYGGIDDVIADPQVQVVHVCTPNALHKPYAEAALKAGEVPIHEKFLPELLRRHRGHNLTHVMAWTALSVVQTHDKATVRMSCARVQTRPW